MVSHYVNSHISTQHRACVYVLLYECNCKWSYGPSCPVDFPLNIFIHSVLLLFELLFVSCPLLLADDTGMLVDFICISCCE